MAPKKKQRTKTFPVNWQKLDADANEGADAKQAELAKQKELEDIVDAELKAFEQTADVGTEEQPDAPVDDNEQAADEGADAQQAEQAVEKETRTSRGRGNKQPCQEIEFGKGIDGKPLPMDDPSKWSDKQRKCFLKNLPILGDKVNDAWDAALNNNDKETQRKIVNSIIPNGVTSQALKVKMGGSQIAQWQIMLKGERKASKGVEKCGMTMREALHYMIGQSKDEKMQSLRDALEEGSMYEKDNMYWWHRKFEKDVRVGSESITFWEAGDVDDATALED